MKRPFLVVLALLSFGIASCGGTATSNNGASMQPSTSDEDSAGGNTDSSANGSTDENPNAGGSSGKEGSAQGASSNAGGATPGTGGLPDDPGSNDADAGDDFPDDPPPKNDAGRPGFVTCKPEMRGAVACILIYDPVCGEVDTGIVCITTPCPTLEYQDFGNSCEACSDDKVNGYWPGTCDDNDK